MKNFLRYLLMVSSGIWLCACSNTALQIKLNPAAYLNPDDQNRALPVQLIIYQLREDLEFRQATFQELWQNDAAVLGETLVSRRAISVVPAKDNKITLNLNKETHYIGIVAIFRRPSADNWRIIKKLTARMPLMTKALTVNLQGNHIAINGGSR